MGSNGAIKQAARAGLGISFVSRDAVAAELDARLLGRIRVEPGPAPREWQVLRSRIGPPAPVVAEFVEFTRAAGASGRLDFAELALPVDASQRAWSRRRLDGAQPVARVSGDAGDARDGSGEPSGDGLGDAPALAAADQQGPPRAVPGVRLRDPRQSWFRCFL